MPDKKTTIIVIALKGFPDNTSFLEIVLAKYLPRHSFEVVFLLQVEPEYRRNGMLSWHGCDVVPVSSLPTRSRFTRLLNRYTKPFLLSRQIRRIAADKNQLILHVRDDWLSGSFIHNMARKLSIPLVFQVSRPGHEFHYYKGRQEKNPLLRGYSFLAGYLEKTGALSLMKKADFVLPISMWMQADLEKLGIPVSKMLPVPMGFDPDASNQLLSRVEIRERLNIGTNPLVVYFGTMWPGRDLEFLLRVFNAVLIIHPKALLYMIGGDPPDILRLRTYASSLGIEEQVIFTGKVNRQEVYEHLTVANVSVSPIPPIPAFLSSSPTKLIEALGIGCPVVASDIPEQQLILKESGGGISVPYEETAFAEKIITLLSDPVAAAEMGNKGKKYILEKRNYAKMALALSEVYNRVMKEART